MSNAMQSSETQRNAMNSNEVQGNSLNFNEMQRNSVNITEPQSGFFKLDEDGIPIGDKTEFHTNTLKQTHEKFLARGVVISLTTIWRKCQKDKKSGLSELDAIKDSSTNMIFITDKSIDTAIMQELVNRSKIGNVTIKKPANDSFSGERTSEDNKNAYKKLKVDYEALQREHQQLKEDNARDKGTLSAYERNWKDMKDLAESIARAVAQEVGSNVGRLEEPKKVTEVINDESSVQSNEP